MSILRSLPVALPAAMLAVSALGPGPGRAQQAMLAEPTLPAYRVELIVFERLSPRSGGEDQTAYSLPPPRVGEMPPASPAPAAGQGTPAPEPLVTKPPFFRPVATGELADLHGKLARSAAYRPLAWVAWEQPGYPREQARPIEFARLLQLSRAAGADAVTTPPRDGPAGMAGAELDGEVTLWLSRYLHLGLDLRQGAADAPSARLDQWRRMRSRTLHYFDAPRLGAIAVIVPVEEAPPVDADQPGSSAGS